MATFVLIPGSCLGAWVWRRVVARLFAAGHHPVPITLTGLAERRHLLRRDIDAETHIQDVLNALEVDELDDVVLVGHSFAGLVATAVASRVPSRIRALVYLDPQGTFDVLRRAVFH